MARYAIHTDQAFGVSMGNIQSLARQLGRSHELAAKLWDTQWYEARMLTAYVDEPEKVTSAQMDRWCRDFDNWAICDTLCFSLFDRTSHAWRKIDQWSSRKAELEKRAAFALLACVALHDKEAGDEPFVKRLPLLEGAATDERNFVKKAVSWALRSIGRRSVALNATTVSVARRLAASDHATGRWVGKDVLKDITRPAVLRGLATKRRKTSGG